MPGLRKPQFTIGSMMALIAVLAVILASGVWAGVLVAPLVWPVALWTLSIPAARWFGGSRTRAMFWLSVGYPWFALPLTMALLSTPITQSTFYHRPTAGFALIALLWGFLISLMVGMVLLYWEFLETLERDEPNWRRQVARLLLIPLISWVGVIFASGSLSFPPFFD